MNIMKLRAWFLITPLLIIGVCLAWCGVVSTQESNLQMRDVMKLLFKARHENKFYGTVTMEIFGPDSQQIYSKKVWADFPGRYHEEFIRKPSDPFMFEWLQRRKYFFTFEHPDRLPPFAPRRPFPGRMPGGMAHNDTTMGMGPGMFLLRNFESHIIAGDTLLNRPTYFVTLTPEMPFRPEMQLWIDREHGTILRFKLLRHEDKNWAPRYLEYFTSIEYNPQFDPNIFTEDSIRAMEPPRRPFDMRAPANVEELSNIEDIKGHVSIPVIIPKTLPAGFSLERIRLVHGEGSEVLHLHYSDGIYAFSIFQSEGVVPPPFGNLLHDKHPKPNEIIDFSRGDRTVLYKYAPPINLVLVGNCQESLLRSILEGLKRSE